MSEIEKRERDGGSSGSEAIDKQDRGLCFGGSKPVHWLKSVRFDANEMEDAVGIYSMPFLLFMAFPEKDPELYSQ